MPISRKSLTLVVAVRTLSAVTPVSMSGQTMADDAISAMISKRVQSGAITGIVAAMIDGQGKRHVLSAGTSDVAGLPLDEHAVFEIGSVTKTFTATILADMVLKGEISLDDPIQKYLPATVTVPSRNGRAITIRDLATHTSGLPKVPSNLNQIDPENPYAAYTVNDLYDYISSYKLTRDPGVKFEYSNTGVGLLGHILSLRANTSYEALLQERVLAPLGMNETRITLTPTMKAHLTQGHDKNGNAKDPWDLPTIAGAGAIRSTAHDLLIYLATQRDTINGPLAKAIAMTHRNLHAGPNTLVTIGLAWHRETTANGQTIVYHSGETGGYHAFIGFNTSTGANAILLANTTGPIDEIGLKIMDKSVILKADLVEPVIALSVLQSYVGSYQVRPGIVFNVTLRNGRLVIGQPGKNGSSLYAESETVFHINGPNAGLVFHLSLNGDVIGLDLRTGDEYEWSPRIPDK